MLTATNLGFPWGLPVESPPPPPANDEGSWFTKAIDAIFVPGNASAPTNQALPTTQTTIPAVLTRIFGAGSPSAATTPQVTTISPSPMTLAPEPWYKSPWPWVGVGVGAVAVTGLVYVIFGGSR